MAFLEIDKEKEQRIFKEKKKEMADYFKMPDHKEICFNPKFMELIVKYLGVINFSTEKIKEVLEIFQ